MHFVAPRPFDEIVPAALPGPARVYTLVSGAAELVTAALLARTGTRRAGGWTAAALFVVVFPANVAMAIDWSDRDLADRLVAYARLPLQVPLVWWAVRVARRSPSDGGEPALATASPG